MVTLKIEPLDYDLPYKEITEIDSLANTKEAAKILNLHFPSRLRKSDVVDMIDGFFQAEPLEFVAAMPADERKMVIPLIGMKQEEYITVPKSEKFLVAQKLHLVLTAEVGHEWHIYMPNNVRKQLNDAINTQIKGKPELEDFNNGLSLLTETNKRISALMINNNPEKLTKQQGKAINREVKELISNIDKAEKMIKRAEPKLKNANVDFKVIYDAIEQGRLYCQIMSFATVQ